MPEPIELLPTWASTVNFPASVYPATLPWGDPHPQAGAPTPWSNQPTKDASGLAGVAGQGHVPAKPTLAPQFNKWLEIASQWVQWLQENSDNPGNASKVLKTDADGTLTLAELVAGGSTTAASTVSLTQPTSNGPCLNISHGGQNFAMVVSSATGTLAAARFLATGPNPAIEAINLGGNGAAIKATGDNDKPGIDCFGDVSGPGGLGLGGSTNGAGFHGKSQSNAPGIQGDGSAANPASPGVAGYAKHVQAVGVLGSCLAGADVLANGVSGVGLGNGNGGKFASEDGYAILLVPDLSSPARGHIRMTPQDSTPADPTSFNGDLSYVDLGGSNQYLHAYVAGTWQYVQIARKPRNEDSYDEEIGSVAVGIGSNRILDARPQMTQRAGGSMFVTARTDLSRVNTSGTITATLESQDVAGGANNVVHETKTMYVTTNPTATTESTREIVFVKKIAPPNTNNREYFIRITNPGGVQAYTHLTSVRVQGEYF